MTGQPIWPIEEKPVPQGDTPGEKYSKTQPIPSKPVAYNRQGLAVDDLIDFTPALRAEAVKAIEQYKIGPVFTPPVVSKADGPIATLQMANRAMGKVVFRRYGAKRSAAAVGRMIPLGIGAAIGGTANYTAIRSLARHADEFFTRLPYSAIDADSIDVTGRLLAT